MDHRIKNRIQNVLRQEQRNRVIDDYECPFLRCIGRLTQTNVSLLEDHLQRVLTNYSSRFKSALALMHYQTPVQQREEKIEKFKKRLDTYYETVISALKNRDVSRYVNIYLYAVATILEIPVYVLMEDEKESLSWFYFPQLFEVSEDEKLHSISGLRYITLFMYRGMTACLQITSTDLSAEPPTASGYIGMQNDTLKAETVDTVEVPAGIMRLHGELKVQRKRLISKIDRELMHTCSAVMLQRGVITQEQADKFIRHRMDHKLSYAYAS